MQFNKEAGNLIDLALEGHFDVITHGCNCFCTMGAGIAVPMAKHFGCDNFSLETHLFKGDINKLGCIDYQWKETSKYKMYVVNSYTQFGFGSKFGPPVDYAAIELCMKKINHQFKGKHIGIPGLIGCGLAGGNENIVESILRRTLVDCNVSIIYLNGVS